MGVVGAVRTQQDDPGRHLQRLVSVTWRIDPASQAATSNRGGKRGRSEPYRA